MIQQQQQIQHRLTEPTYPYQKVSDLSPKKCIFHAYTCGFDFYVYIGNGRIRFVISGYLSTAMEL